MQDSRRWSVSGDEIDALNFASKSINASGRAQLVFRLLREVLTLPLNLLITVVFLDRLPRPSIVITVFVCTLPPCMRLAICLWWCRLCALL